VDQEQNELEQATRRRPWLWIGAVLSVAYLVFVAIWWGSADPIRLLTPSEFGDFLAGVFAPLAFFWLVLGFLQQGQELSLQINELRQSVKAQADLVIATRDLRELEAEIHRTNEEHAARIAAPILKITEHGFSSSSDNKRIVKFQITNSGKTCTALTLFSEKKLIRRPAMLETGAVRDFAVTVDSTFSGNLDVEAEYIDGRSLPGETRWKIKFTDGHAERIFEVRRGKGARKLSRTA